MRQQILTDSYFQNGLFKKLVLPKEPWSVRLRRSLQDDQSRDSQFDNIFSSLARQVVMIDRSALADSRSRRFANAAPQCEK
ncbi:MAG: hypothetical protein EBV64_06390 [Oxalobacteraceae bacterium]|nr:hypothetical protein [Oxalobacteraceae bacterium]